MALTPEQRLERIKATQRKRRLEHPEQVRAVERAYRARIPVTLRRKQQKERNLRYCYGMSLAEYESRLQAQNGVCAICREPSPRTLQVDHDHHTNKIRGLLCHICNQGMIAVDRRPNWLTLVPDYLEDYTVGPD